MGHVANHPKMTPLIILDNHVMQDGFQHLNKLRTQNGV